jgi:hypothetical protein
MHSNPYFRSNLSLFIVSGILSCFNYLVFDYGHMSIGSVELDPTVPAMQSEACAAFILEKHVPVLHKVQIQTYLSIHQFHGVL